MQEACERVVKEKISVLICPVRFNLLGLPRSGKTTFRLRLLGVIVDISWFEKTKGPYMQPSTGAAEDGGQIVLQIECSDMGTISPEAWRALKDLPQQAAMISQLLYQAVQLGSPTNRASPPPRASRHHHSTQQQPSANPDLTSTAPSEEADVNQVLSVVNEALKAGDLDKVKFALDNLTLVITTDIGGQAEFLDLQASLIQGPSFNLLFSRLVDKLDDQFDEYYTNEKGESTEKVDSITTKEEVLFQTLSSIACFSGCFTEEASPQEASPQASAQEDKSQSKVMVIGTHRDLVSEEDFKRADRHLQEKIRNTEFFNRGIVEFAAEGQLMLAVDNMTGGEEEMKMIRKVLERVIVRSFKKISIPAAWLLFNLKVRSMNVRTMSLRECEELAKNFRISREELRQALWFLHHRVGALLYYPEVEALKDTVICQMQVVFDSATNLIKNTFTFDKAGQAVSERFREKAQFSLQDVKAAMSEHSSELLPPEKLVQLLQYLGILTPIPSTPSSGTQSTYFMPCVLKSAPASELAAPSSSKTDPAPLMIRYDCGYLPVGVFPSMITNLVSSQQAIGWEMIEEGLRKNRVQFRVLKDCDMVTLTSHSRYFQISISRLEDCTTTTESLCSHVRSVVQSTLKTATSRMNYNFTMGYRCCFQCLLHPSRKHLCEVTDESSTRMFCLQNPKNKQPVSMQSQQSVWFAAPRDSSSTDLSCCVLPAPCTQPASGGKPLLHQLEFLKVGDKRKRIIEEVGVDWEQLAYRLEFDHEVVRAIKANNKDNEKRVESSCRDMLCRWLDGEGCQDVTWRRLVEAIEDVPRDTLARDLEKLLLH